MKLKPLPKLILIVAVVAAAGFGISTALKSQKPAVDPNAAPAPAVTVVAPPTNNPATTPAASPSTPAPVAAAPAPAPAPVEQPSGLKPAGGQDAGLDAVLRAGKK